MAKKIDAQRVYELVACSGREGVLCDWHGMLRRWKIDGRPCDLAQVVRDLIRGHRLRYITKATGDGKQQRFVVAVTTPV